LEIIKIKKENNENNSFKINKEFSYDLKIKIYIYRKFI